MKKSSFPGKRKLKCCNSWVCPHAKHKKPGVPGHPKLYTEGAQSKTVFMPTSLILSITRYANRIGRSFSQAVVELVKKGLGGS